MLRSYSWITDQRRTDTPTYLLVSFRLVLCSATKSQLVLEVFSGSRAALMEAGGYSTDISD